MFEINLFAVVVAGLSMYLIGGAWYSPKMFGEIWTRESGLQKDHYNGGHQSLVFIGAGVLSLIAAFGVAVETRGNTDVKQTVVFCLLVAVMFIATSIGINQLFGRRSLKIFLIDSGYTVVQFVTYGVILGLWK